jgi:hypothetical protein
MSTSLSKQIKQIHSFSLETETEPFEESTRNIVLNSLKLETELRTISTSAVCSNSKDAIQTLSIYKETINTISCIKKDE